MAATEVSRQNQLRAVILQMQKQRPRRRLMQQQIMFYVIFKNCAGVFDHNIKT